MAKSTQNKPPEQLHTRIKNAKQAGLSNKLIAERLEISERTVRRALEFSPLSKDYTNVMVGTDLEWTVWKFYRDAYGWSLRKIAKHFCLSHEHIRKTIESKTNGHSVNKQKELV